MNAECGARNERAPHEASKIMDQLYPIIRRVRRSLVAVDNPPMLAGSVEPANGTSETPIHEEEREKNEKAITTPDASADD